jgi:Phosphodiester glycosidase
MRTAAFLVVLLAATAPAPPATIPGGGPPAWQPLEPGLELGVFQGPPAPSGDRRIHVVRLDPARFELKLLNASAPGEGSLRTAREWSERAGAVAAINAGMFMEDWRTSVSLMRRPGHVNNPRVTKDKAVLAFDRADGAAVPPVQIIDRDCQKLDELMPAYRSFLQSIRLVSCQRKNVWAASDKRWSTAALGVDGAGRVLFVHARTAWPVHELVDALLALPIDLQRAMYLEGGPEAQLFVRAGGRELELAGALHATADAFGESQAWPIPNVLAAVRR